jgi:hypothetical protein
MRQFVHSICLRAVPAMKALLLLAVAAAILTTSAPGAQPSDAALNKADTFLNPTFAVGYI